jgi:hypothetical protein
MLLISNDTYSFLSCMFMRKDHWWEINYLYINVSCSPLFSLKDCCTVFFSIPWLWVSNYHGSHFLYFFQINDFARSRFRLGGSCGACRRCRHRCLFILTLSLGCILLRFMTYSHVLAQAVFVLKGFLTVVALSWWLGGVLRSYVSPEVNRSNYEFTVLTLSPFAVGLLARFLLSFYNVRFLSEFCQIFSRNECNK